MPSPAAVPSPSSMLDNLDFRTAHLGHFPLIRALITKLGIDRVLNEVLPQDPRSYPLGSAILFECPRAGCG